MGINIGGEIEKVNGKELSYEEFVERYLEKNQPVVLTGLMMDDGWRNSCTDWVTQDGKPNLRFFSSHFGKSKVQVADCGKREFTDQKRIEMSVSEFIDNWVKFSSEQCSSSSSYEGNMQSLLYMKDWHFVKEYPEYVAYTTPLFFRDDWLNLYLDSYDMHTDPGISLDRNEVECSDYRFVYMGSKGTWTPLHADVFRSYSWSANVCGKKKWFLLSPSQCHLVFDRHMKSCIYDIFEDVSETKFPGFKKAIWLECTQEQNEIIFVPSGWYHQVQNMEDTISINHNWFNAYNLSWVWKLLLKDYNEAKEYIEDIKDICDDFEGLCQRNLAANTGMNFTDFFIFITRFTIANLTQLHSLTKDHYKHIYDTSPIVHHLISNLTSIKKVASNMKPMEIFVSGNFNSFLNIEEVMKESEFMRMYSSLGRIYPVLRDLPSKYSSDAEEEAIGVDLKAPYFGIDSSCEISSPDDLIKLIDNVVTNLDKKLGEPSSFVFSRDKATRFTR